MDQAVAQDNDVPSNLLRHCYRVTSIEKAATPDGAEGGEWYRYVLASGQARITGLHRGSLAEVTAYANSCAEEFNLRSAMVKGASPTPYAKKR